MKENELTQREEQILKLLLAGFLQKQIASHLGISESSVQNTKAAIKRKWAVTNDIELFLKALSEGYFDRGNESSNGLVNYYSNSTAETQFSLVYTFKKAPTYYVHATSG